MTNYGDLVAETTATCGELVMGIDPTPKDIESSFSLDLRGHVVFMLVAARDAKLGFVKFQSAYFEAFGSEGVRHLSRCIRIAKDLGLSVILDVKRGDIGSTAEAYADAYLKKGHSDFEVDCITVSPFMGPDSIQPFVDRCKEYGKGLFILTKTSNTGSEWLQNQMVGHDLVYHKVCDLINGFSLIGKSGLSSIGAVVGLTSDNSVRKIVPNAIILAPGLGAQGGNPEYLKNMRRSEGNGLLVPVSRGLMVGLEGCKSYEECQELMANNIEKFNRIISD